MWNSEGFFQWLRDNEKKAQERLTTSVEYVIEYCQGDLKYFPIFDYDMEENSIYRSLPPEGKIPYINKEIMRLWGDYKAELKSMKNIGIIKRIK
ncbi:MAG: hypothetical protein ACOX3R_09305 [Desulfitobacteriia bacterium]|jgi:hypothetical protein